MKVVYDNEVDAVYIQLGAETPEGVSEIGKGVNLDLTETGHIVGIEILDASKRMDISTILSYALEVDRDLLQPA